ncbi:hypothetical protein [Methylobacterium sp. SD21]|uniref:hypothetical protein n=1 Tax=Methylobacterium litchii TaxID=3138810 RepID=UPI00313DEC5F
MSFLDFFTGGAGQTAAKNNAAAINTGLQQGGNALLTSYGQGQNYLLGSDQGPGAFQYATGGYDRARGDVASQYGQTQNYLGQATSAYQPLVSNGLSALGSYYDAIGANGAEGSQRATAAFQAAPGYDYTMDSALGAVQRSAAARGGLAGGNATADILKTATGLANQGFQQYVDNLKGGVGTYTTGVQGLANGLTTQGGASQSYGNALSALGTGQGNMQASILGQGAALQQSLGNQFNALINNSTGALVSNNNALAASQTKASENALGAIVGLGKSALDFNPFKGL